MGAIRLAGYTFDPLLEPVPGSLPAGLTLVQDVPGACPEHSRREANDYLVQFHGPIQPAWKAELAAAGAQIMDYIPDLAFIVRMDGATRAAVASMQAVRWVGLYQPGYRIAPSLMSTPAADAQAIEVVVSVFDGQDAAALAKQIQELGGTVHDVSKTHRKGRIVARLTRVQVNAAARLPGIRWIEPAPTWRLLNEQAADIMSVREVWDTHGLYGAGQIVAVCDTGLDRGSTDPSQLHDDLEDGSGGSRVLRIYNRSPWPFFDGADDVNSGHGTHVAGSVLGNGARSGSSPGSHVYPPTAYAGMAPEASLVFQAVEDNATGFLWGIPSDLNILFGQVLGDGARIHTNSWGSEANGEYTLYAEDVDAFVWAHPDFTVLFAAGNEGMDANGDGVVDPSSLDSPGTAKNCITVGATENDRPGQPTTWGSAWPDDYPAAPIHSDRIADDPGGMAAFSSRGPATDGRIKPDLLAPGTFIASIRSSVASGSGNWGPINAYYWYMGGTSMATPLVAGAAAVVREYYVDIQGIVPSAALIKATLIHGATDIYPGQYGSGEAQEIPAPRPNSVEGWGQVNVEHALFPAPPRTWIYRDETAGLETGEATAYILQIVDASEPLHVTLAWSDYPGSPAASSALVNDLDLSVTGPGGTVYTPSSAAGPAAFDRVNNVVGVEVANPAVGAYTITVQGYNIPFGPQPYALVASGAISTTPPPAVTGVTPASGTNLGTVHITHLAGAHFQPGAAVKLTRTGAPNIAATNIQVLSDTQIAYDLDLAAAAEGPWNVVVTNPDGQSGKLSDGFTVYRPPPPEIAGITPSSGINTGSVHITDLSGSHFQPGATVRLTQSNHPDIQATNVQVVNAARIACDLDLAGAATGPWNVVVTNPDGQSGTLADGFTVHGSPTAPTVTGITPSRAASTGSVRIMDLAGSRFQSAATVQLTRLGRAPIAALNVTVVSSNAITCDLGLAGVAPGLWNVVVTNPDGQSGHLTNGFTVTGFTYLPLMFKED